ncbi:hypothetical protein E2C01_017194 [Portunus trituberculatus]|uniref:Uncharacterized protein n=1 Tax=Portunus trituberculatus TaxID=210409 RepID=A0A5B7DQY6_PORTR|nr:hypothetical protein [Portunus trituberculatus]
MVKGLEEGGRPFLRLAVYVPDRLPQDGHAGADVPYLWPLIPDYICLPAAAVANTTCQKR